MTDTTTTLAPSAAMTSGALTVAASAALFTVDDIGRCLAIMATAPARTAATAYGNGSVFVSTYAGIDRLYRVIQPGTTAALSGSGTTPAYDLNAPRSVGVTVADGSAVLRYLGTGNLCWGFGVITAFTDATHVTVNCDPTGPFVSTNASAHWKLGEFSTARGWPAAMTIHDQRTWWGGSNTKPTTLWASQTGDFQNMTPHDPDGTVLDTAAITITCDDDQINRIRWLASFARGLAVGTSSAEFTIGPANSNAGLSPNNIKPTHQTDRGSDAGSAPLRISGVILFVQAGGQKLRQLEYDLASDSFTTADLTLLAEDITGPGVLQTGYARLPDGTIWIVRTDGIAASMTFDREQKVRAWCLQQIGGTNAKIESLAIVPAPDGKSDDIYLAVARTINGATFRSVEYIRRPFRPDLDAQAEAFFVDCGLTYRGSPANVFSGLNHLEGQTVRIIADGSERNAQVVVAGSVTATGPAASIVHIGLPYTHRIATLPPETAGEEGTSQGQLKRISEVTLRFRATGGGSFGRAGHMEPIVLRTLAMPMTSAVPLFTGDKRIAFPAGWDRAGQIVVEGSDPLPMTLLAVITELSTNG